MWTALSLFFKSKAGKWVGIAAIIVAILSVFLFFILPAIKKLFVTTVKADTSGDNTSAPATDATKIQAQSLAAQIFNELDGVNATRDIRPYKQLAEGSDSLMKETYNNFADNYSPKIGGQTLIQAIMDESYFWTFGKNSEFKILQETIQAKAQRIGLP